MSRAPASASSAVARPSPRRRYSAASASRIGAGPLRQQPMRQRLQALLPGDGGARAPLRPERQVDVLQRVHRSAAATSFAAQLVGQQLALVQRLEDRLAPLVQLRQSAPAGRAPGDCTSSSDAGRLLAVARDERHGRALRQQRRRRPTWRGVSWSSRARDATCCVFTVGAPSGVGGQEVRGRGEESESM